MSTIHMNCLRYGKGSVATRCALLVVSTDDKLIKAVSTSLLDINDNSYGNKFQIKACSSISLYLKFPNTDHVDYIVLLINPCRYNWQAEVEENIALMDKAYLISRFCLLVDTADVASIHADLSHIKILKKKYSVTVLYGESKRDEILVELSNRLLRLVTGICCNSSGFPSVIEFCDNF